MSVRFLTGTAGCIEIMGGKHKKDFLRPGFLYHNIQLFLLITINLSNMENPLTFQNRRNRNEIFLYFVIFYENKNIFYQEIILSALHATQTIQIVWNVSTLLLYE